MKFKKIGVLGGMGPEASASFYYKLVKYCQKKYNAVQDIDYPPIMIYSLPLHGFDESGVIDNKYVLKQLIEGVKILADSKCDFIVMPCNTVHLFIEELRFQSPIPVISIIEETIKKIKSDNFNFIGLLASESTLKSGLYQKSLDKNCITCLLPDKEEYSKITKLILEVMSGKVKESTKIDILSVIKQMQLKAVNAVVIGCTELPLYITQKDTKIKVYDTSQILAEAAVDFAMNNKLSCKKAAIYTNLNNVQY